MEAFSQLKFLFSENSSCGEWPDNQTTTNPTNQDNVHGLLGFIHCNSPITFLLLLYFFLTPVHIAFISYLSNVDIMGFSP